MLWSIDSNASLTLIAERLGRTVAAVRKKLRKLGYTAENLGGFKVKDVAEMFLVCPARIQYWVAEKHLLTKGGRITESSFSKFLADHPEKGGDRRPYADHSNCKRARSGPPPLRTRLFGKAETLPVSAYRPFLRFVNC